MTEEKRRYRVTFETVIEIEAIYDNNVAEFTDEKWPKDFEYNSLIEEVMRRR